jgi:Bacterial Ig domain
MLYTKKFLLSTMALLALSACGGGSDTPASTTEGISSASAQSVPQDIIFAVDATQVVPADHTQAVFIADLENEGLSTSSVSSDNAPRVQLVSPLPGEKFSFPAKVHIEALASSSDQISKVEFYNGRTLLGTSKGQRISFDLFWPHGDYDVIVKAYDSKGRVTQTVASINVDEKNGGTNVWHKVADQGDEIGVETAQPTAQYFRYGERLNWKYKRIVGVSTCNASSFGGGLPEGNGTAKTCEVQKPVKNR